MAQPFYKEQIQSAFENVAKKKKKIVNSVFTSFANAV